MHLYVRQSFYHLGRRLDQLHYLSDRVTNQHYRPKERNKYHGYLVFAQPLNPGLRLPCEYQLFRYRLTEISRHRFVRELKQPIHKIDLLSDQLRGEGFYHFQTLGYWHSVQLLRHRIPWRELDQEQLQT